MRCVSFFSLEGDYKEIMDRSLRCSRSRLSSLKSLRGTVALRHAAIEFKGNVHRNVAQMTVSIASAGGYTTQPCPRGPRGGKLQV